jgi:hypothetical protein
MKKYLICLLTLTLLGCHKDQYDTGHFQESVINFWDVNSGYDDYNSTAPFIYYRYLFHFSSNRNSSGNDFDIIGDNMYIDWSKVDGTLEIGTDLDDDTFEYLTPMFDSINTSCNELGPYALGFRQDISDSEVLWTDLLMFANDREGDYDIKYIYSELYNSSGINTTEITGVRNVVFLNSGANDLYPSFFGNDLYYFDEWGIEASKVDKILFCSDREGPFNLYEVDVPSDSTLINTLQSDTRLDVVKLPISSGQEDKCPFVNGKLLVFASNRTGGYGGYDLYYSEYDNGNWTEPTNFGEGINTEYDEYRPIILHYHDFDNNLMIFSSNRPGGKGGFDLYHVGIKQMIK